MKRFLTFLLLLMMPCLSLADALPTEGPAPYPPVVSAYTEDLMGYDDGSLKIRIVEDMAFDTKIYYIYVTMTDATQIRTATAGDPRSTKSAKAAEMAVHNNAVLAVNGDFYSGHHSGVSIRQGKLVRNKPVSSRDALFIDENADLHILPSLTAADLEDFQTKHEIREAFCFGPGLIIDGVKQEFDYRLKNSCGYPTKAQRMIMCQTGPLEYLFLATEGPEQNQPGLSVPECMTLLEAHGGIQQAYNLDGGNSVSIIMNGEKLNARDFKTREIGDIIYFATTVAP